MLVAELNTSVLAKVFPVPPIGPYGNVIVKYGEPVQQPGQDGMPTWNGAAPTKLLAPSF